MVDATDIDSHFGAHMVVERTHDHKRFKDLKHLRLDDDEAQKKFGFTTRQFF